MARDVVYTFAQLAEEYKQGKQNVSHFPKSTRMKFFEAYFDTENDGVCVLFYRLKENTDNCHWYEDSKA
jgi:hypothetical protein